MPKAPASSGIQRTSWSSSEAATLVATLTNEKAEGRQAESGFKAISYKTAAADQLRIHVKVKSVKQCQDHWKKLKDDFKIVQKLRQQSGFGWNDETKTVTAELAVWEAYIKNNPKAGPFRKRGFPLYDSIAAIVEGVIATGANVIAIGGSVSQSTEDLQDHADDNDSEKEASENGASEPDEPRTPLRAATATPLRTSTLKRKHREDRVSGPQALSHLARSIDNLAAASTEDLAGPVGSMSLARRKKAWMVVVEEEDLSDSELALVPKIFRGRADVADEYLAFPAHKKAARRLWLVRELANIQGVE